MKRTVTICDNCGIELNDHNYKAGWVFVTMRGKMQEIIFGEHGDASYDLCGSCGELFRELDARIQARQGRKQAV